MMVYFVILTPTPYFRPSRDLDTKTLIKEIYIIPILIYTITIKILKITLNANLLLIFYLKI